MFRSMQGISIRQKDFLEGGEREVSRLFPFYVPHSVLFFYLCHGYEITYTYSKLFPKIHRLTEKNI